MEINAEARAILEHNDDVRARIECLQKEIEELRATIKPPCAHCPLTGCTAVNPAVSPATKVLSTATT
jgi:hypothetical protein